MKYRFFVGCNGLNQTCQNNLQSEIKKWEDIVVFSVSEFYRNVSLKVVSSLFWPLLSEESLGYDFDYYVKVDEDVYVDAERLFGVYTALRDGRYQSMQIGRFEKQPQVIRDPQSKWFVSQTKWRSKFFNPYMIGPLHLTSRKLIKDIFKYLRLKNISSAAFQSIYYARKGFLGDQFITEIHTTFSKKAFYLFEDVFLGYLILQSQNESAAAFLDQGTSIYTVWPTEKCFEDSVGIHGFNHTSMENIFLCQQNNFFRKKCLCI
jgi:hypothetical protein